MTTTEFSHPFSVDKLGPNPKKIHLEATTDEIEELCTRFDLLGMDYLKGHVILKRLSGKKIECRFEASSKITQECVITFKPVTNTINLTFQRVYDGALNQEKDEKEIEIDVDASDELDPIIDGVIDLAAAVSEELGLEIDPFPRADDTDFTEYGAGPDITEEEVQANNPFAVLADLKNKSD